MKWSNITAPMLDIIPKRDADNKIKGAILKSKFYVMTQDNFTVLLMRNNGVIVCGVAKCNPRDNYNPEVAGKVAFVRAYRSFKKAYYETR